MSLYKYRLAACVTLLCLLAALAPVFAQEDGTAIITTPADNEQLFGLVQISGTAAHPTLFAGYSLDFSNVQTPDIWVPIQPRINQQVNDGILGQWDTAQLGVPDGTYSIRLQVFLSDGSVLEAIIRDLALVNSTPTQVPSVAPIVPAATLPGLPTAGPSPTSMIQQPPTITPAPTFEEPAPVTFIADTPTGDSLFNFSAVQSAFCSGVYMTTGFFGLVLGYLLMRRQISPYTRRLWWQIRSELQDDQRDY